MRPLDSAAFPPDQTIIIDLVDVDPWSMTDRAVRRMVRRRPIRWAMDESPYPQRLALASVLRRARPGELVLRVPDNAATKRWLMRITDAQRGRMNYARQCRGLPGYDDFTGEGPR